MQQILKNLLSNAFKFTERGTVSLSVEANEDGFAFAVRDTGIGIAKSHHSAIFEAFQQADGTTNRRFGGTGLGLSISRDLAHMLGGELRVESELGSGSCFTLTLPKVFSPGRGTQERFTSSLGAEPKPCRARARAESGAARRGAGRDSSIRR